MTVEAFAIYSILAGLVAYLVLSIFFVVGLTRQITGRAALLASVATVAWLASLAVIGDRIATHLLEATMLVAWSVLAARILGVSVARINDPSYRTQTHLTGALLGSYIVYVVLLTPAQAATAGTIIVLGKLAFCLFGLVMVEQVARNTRRDYQWNLKLLTIGLGIIFGYGFVLYADALLFKSVSLTLFAPQGLLLAVAAPFIAIASLRNKSHRMHFNVSREFVFRSGTLVIGGAYLLIMGLAGYYVRFSGGQLGDVLQVLIIAAGLIGLVLLAVSTRIRSTLRVWLLRNLYEYKYDYRDEWLRVTRELTESSPDDTLADRAIHALGELVNCTAGAYWRLSPDGTLLPVAQLHTPWREPFSPASSASLAEFVSKRFWVIDLDEYRDNPDAYPGLTLNADLGHLPRARFLVPLMIQDQLFGVVGLAQPTPPPDLIWEDYDILKIVASQAAGFLALHYADEVLSASEQLRSMDQLSAFIVHDLKTVNAQLALLANNAPRHRDNPAFIDDMLHTVENAVQRTGRLVDQLRQRDEATQARQFDLRAALQGVVSERSAQSPAPVLTLDAGPVTVFGDENKLSSALAHIVQNAQDAAGDNGKVAIELSADDQWITVDVCDNGCGMTREFIHSKLFKPFTTTKGLAGIGIGAYQCREYIRGLGGDVAVESEPGKGTRFTLRLPVANTDVVSA